MKKKSFLPIAIIIMVSFLLIQNATSKESKKGVCSDVTIEKLQKHVPIPNGEIESMREKNGLCEIILNIQGQYVPIYAKDEFVVAGEMFQDRKQITQEKINELKAVAIKENIAELDNATSITYTPKNAGKRKFYMITDPLCPYCNTAASNIKTILDENKVTLKTILYTVHGDEGKKKIKTAICKKFSLEQYADGKWKTEKNETGACKEAEDLIAKGIEITQKIGITGVPAFIFEDGQIVSGANLGKINEILKNGKMLSEK